MIIKGNPAGNVGFWTRHLQSTDNERAEVVEIRGLLAEDLPTGLREMEAVAAGSRSHGNFMYQANISPLAYEHLTPEQWTEAVDTLEKNLGLEGHQRIVVEHEKRGEDGELRTHRHVIWNRVDVDDLRVADMGGNWRTHERTARELEQRFDLTPSPGHDRGSLDRKPALELWEIRAAERSGIAPADVKAELTELWRQSESGQGFAAALDERGYILAKGDRRDFCVIDQAGDVHSLARRLDGVKAAEVRARMVDVDRDSLPTVAEARQEQRTRDQPALELQGRRVERSASDQRQWRMDTDASRARVTDATTPREPSPGLLVGNAVTGAAESLVDFVGGLFSGTKPPPTAKQLDQLDQIKAQRKALTAIENIRDSMERGERLKPEDVLSLTATHLENIKLRGDDYMRSLIESAERSRDRYLDYERERER